MIIKQIIAASLFLIVIISCNNDEKEKKGFIIFEDPDHWYFVPTKTMSNDDCFENFQTNNLEFGTQFRPFFENSSVIKHATDTVKLEDIAEGQPLYAYSLKIVPVMIEYKIDDSKIATHSVFKHRVKIKGSFIDFQYNVLPIHIIRVKPLVCNKR